MYEYRSIGRLLFFPKQAYRRDWDLYPKWRVNGEGFTKSGYIAYVEIFRDYISTVPFVFWCFAKVGHVLGGGVISI